MGYPLTQALIRMPASAMRIALTNALTPVYGALSTESLTTAGLAITGATSPTVKSGATAYYALVNGVLVLKAAATAMPALAGTVASATFNVFVFTVDGAGTLYSQMGGAGATLGAIKFPAIAAKRAILGFIIVNPTGAGSFVGGTTALDDAGVIPNVVYLSPTGSFDPSSILA